MAPCEGPHKWGGKGPALCLFSLQEWEKGEAGRDRRSNALNGQWQTRKKEKRGKKHKQLQLVGFFHLGRCYSSMRDRPSPYTRRYTYTHLYLLLQVHTVARPHPHASFSCLQPFSCRHQYAFPTHPHRLSSSPSSLNGFQDPNSRIFVRQRPTHEKNYQGRPPDPQAIEF